MGTQRVYLCQIVHLYQNTTSVLHILYIQTWVSWSPNVDLGPQIGDPDETSNHGYVVDQRVAKRRVVREPEAKYAPGIARGEMGLRWGDSGVAWQQQRMPMMIPSP